MKNTQKAAREILKLIEEKKLSVAEIKGAAWEALLMIMKMPTTVKYDIKDSMS